MMITGTPPHTLLSSFTACRSVVQGYFILKSVPAVPLRPRKQWFPPVPACPHLLLLLTLTQGTVCFCFTRPFILQGDPGAHRKRPPPITNLLPASPTHCALFGGLSVFLFFLLSLFTNRCGAMHRAGLAGNAGVH